MGQLRGVVYDQNVFESMVGGLGATAVLFRLYLAWSF